ncbi:MAG: serine hydrolase [Clostridia bacterium]|nr:serine hydrolase [Clostridia bacterium]
MDINYKKALDLIETYFINGKSRAAQIRYAPQKTESSFSHSKISDIPRSLPESVGVSSRLIDDFLSELEREMRAVTHSLLIVCDGKVICDASAPGYNTAEWHLCHSLSKSVTALAIGILIDEGRLSLDTSLFDIFGKSVGKELRSATVKNLLEMSIPHTFGELGSLVSESWTEDYLGGSLKADIGEELSYNSMNSYILSVIVKEVSGVDLFDFLKVRLFAPLGIKNVLWEKSPEEISKGGWGLYLSNYDMTKIGMLYLNGGVYNGTRIISEEFIKNSAVSYMQGKDGESYDYGRHLWVNKNARSYLFNGMLGQNLWICPESNMVISVFSGNDELFQESALLGLIAKYFDPSVFSRSRLRKNRGAYRRLRIHEKHFFEMRSYTEKRKCGFFNRRFNKKRASELSGKQFDFASNNASLLPLFTRVMQSNYTDGLSSLTVLPIKDGLLLSFGLGEDVFEINAGFYSFRRSVLDFNGEPYTVAARCNFTESEDREKILKLELIYPELPNAMKISLCYEDMQNAKISLREIPGKNMAERLMRSVTDLLPRSFGLLVMMKPQFNPELLRYKITNAFSPTVLGALHVDDGQLPPPSENYKVFAEDKTSDSEVLLPSL